MAEPLAAQDSPPVPQCGIIKEIDQDSIKHIAAGQKISDIEAAIRELVENSIDAEAKNIEVRLSRFGIDSIEVEDNGIGIKEEDFGTLGMRYHTSKISSYAKLQDSLETFGFRGEALSCLCNIANVTITTKTKSSPTGTKLVFKKDGTVTRMENVARTTGTTVILKNLFQTMPVRRRELETTAKRHYDRVVKLLYEQVLARPHIRFSLCKKNNAKKEKDFIHGGSTLEGCIITIYGIKVLESLVPFKQFGLVQPKVESDQQVVKIEERTAPKTRQSLKSRKPGESDSREFQESLIKDDFETTVEPIRDEFFKRSRKSAFAREKPEYTVHGYISKLGCGKNSNDCQYIFVNKKPCDIPKVSKTINDFFRANSNGQYPFYCLFIQVQTWAADFNVPRKRAVILQDDCKLVSLVRDSLESMFSACAPSTQKSCPIAQIPMTVHKSKVEDQKHGSKRALEADHDYSTQPNKKQQTSNAQPCSDSHIADFSDKGITRNGISHENIEEPVLEQVNATVNDDTMISRPSNSRFQIQKHNTTTRETEIIAPADCTVVAAHNDTGFKSALDIIGEQQRCSNIQQTVPPSVLSVDPITDLSPALNIECRFETKITVEDGKLKVNIGQHEDLGAALERERLQRKAVADSKEFSYAIHPTFNTVAEQELKFNLNKKSFEDMQVLGQFNKGFIITKLNKHIFIIDQHATDERANFENQLDKYPLMKQPMVYPKLLYLNYIQENAIINNLDAFTKRGFEFLIDKTKNPGFRVKLTSTSICKGQGMDEHLAKEDVEELIDVILESPNQLATYTLKKVRNVAASRACRKSVMIGDRLNWAQMDDIVAKMATLQNPWVCAHNRPTIRHLMGTDWLE